MEENNFSFNVVNSDGIEIKCETLAIIKPEEENTGDVYVIYTDYTLDNNNNINVYASLLVQDENGYRLEMISDLENYSNLLNLVQQEYKKINGIEE